MDILQIVNNLVIRNELFAFLDVNDLLRLRRASKIIKNQVSDYIRMQKIQTNREILIDYYRDNPFWEFDEFQQSFNELPISTNARFAFGRFSQTSPVFNASFLSFQDTHWTKITHLTLYGLHVPVYSNRMLQFFDSFPNVKHLVLEHVRPISRQLVYSASSADAQEMQIPSRLKNLKTLKIVGTADLHDDSPSVRSAFDFIVKLVETNLSTLEQLQFPFLDLMCEDGEEASRLASLCLFTSPNLKLVDVDGYLIDDLLKPDNHTLLEMGTLDAVISSINSKIISIRDPRHGSFIPEMSNLEGIDFGYMRSCRMPGSGDFVRRDWPKLKEIKAGLSDNHADHSFSPPNPSQVWDFLFGGDIRRVNLVTLDIAFYGFEENMDQAGTENILARTIALKAACPNVKVLHLGYQIKQLVNLQKLWAGLPLLEKLRFDRCFELKDSDFFGEDPQNPVFLNLKRLQALELKDMDHMNVTDALFRKVLCHMPLRKLSLSVSSVCGLANRPISFDGIRSLLTGKIATTIESLDIEDFILFKEMGELKGLFRCLSENKEEL